MANRMRRMGFMTLASQVRARERVAMIDGIKLLA
jgi:hypothetical protein